MVKKTAVILLNLGGPDRQSAVKPFLFNLFHDPAIIRLPQPFRFLIAALISWRRAPVARKIYAQMGGGSPILKNTQEQANALDGVLNNEPNKIYKSFIAMRYWHPFSSETAVEVKKFKPDEIILLPLYPQFSTTTTHSSLKEWRRVLEMDVPVKTICCYPTESGFIQAMASSLRRAYDGAKHYGVPRILFSAHGLPQKIVDAGDPYQAQCEMTVAALRAELDIENLDWVLCFQSRVGPMRWIGPSTDDEVRRAAKDKLPLIVVPIAFVSDHSETLVEIDIEYRHLAKTNGAPFFSFVPAVGTHPEFIKGLAGLVMRVQNTHRPCMSGAGERICPKTCKACPSTV